MSDHHEIHAAVNRTLERDELFRHQFLQSLVRGHRPVMRVSGSAAVSREMLDRTVHSRRGESLQFGCHHSRTAGIDLIQDIVQIFDNYGLETEIIAASIRNPIHVTDCALAGAHIATVPYKVIEQMTKHPLTDAGIEKFQADYRAVFGD